jgi:uncharacterized protein
MSQLGTTPSCPGDAIQLHFILGHPHSRAWMVSRPRGDARGRPVDMRPCRCHSSVVNVLLTGSSGLIGSSLAQHLQASGHQVVKLVRRRPETGEAQWDPEAGEIDSEAVQQAHAVVHLAGESIASGRWTPQRKDRIVRSRVQGTTLLANALARASDSHRVLIAASAVGWYGDRGDTELDETSEPGQGFLVDVCRQWEQACEPARNAGLRVVHLRIGMVLSRKGGALPIMTRPLRLGLGGRIGSGKQWVSWISLPDLLRVIDHALVTDSLQGPVNAVAPSPVTNRTLTQVLGEVLRRPTWLAAPASAIRLVLGEMGSELLLASARVMPTRLLQSGFRFETPELTAALRAELG